MILPTLDLHQARSRADTHSASNWSANLSALSETQPALVQAIQSLPAHAEWVYARDGSLTARQDNAWFSGCSVPTQAAKKLLQTLNTDAPLSCYLTPTHPAQLEVALDRLDRNQSIVALLPERSDLRLFLACTDFSISIRLHRLWFVTGADWAGELRQLLTDYPGLPTPSQFIRTRLAEEAVIEPLMSHTQTVLSEVLSNRQSMLQMAVKTHPSSHSLCVVAGSHFRLWDNAGSLLFDTISQRGIAHCRVDLDDPINISPLALAQAAQKAGGIIAANVARMDAPYVAPIDLPWITWVTRLRTIDFASSGSKDALLLVDSTCKQLYMDQGWPENRLAVADWPTRQSVNQNQSTLALIADTRTIEKPKTLTDYSSHTLLWEEIESLLSVDPFALTGDAGLFLLRMKQQRNISDDALDTSAFIERLILPLYQQGLARFLLRAGIPLRLYGKGWDTIEDLKQHWHGSIQSQQALESVADQSAGLVYAWPLTARHAIESLGRPVVRRTGSKDTLLRNARQALSGGLPAIVPDHPLQFETIAQFLPH